MKNIVKIIYGIRTTEIEDYIDENEVLKTAKMEIAVRQYKMQKVYINKNNKDKIDKKENKLIT